MTKFEKRHIVQSLVKWNIYSQSLTENIFRQINYAEFHHSFSRIFRQINVLLKNFTLKLI